MVSATSSLQNAKIIIECELISLPVAYALTTYWTRGDFPISLHTKGPPDIAQHAGALHPGCTTAAGVARVHSALRPTTRCAHGPDGVVPGHGP